MPTDRDILKRRQFYGRPSPELMALWAAWAASVKSRTRRAWKLREPLTGWPDDFGAWLVEMLCRGYEITLVPRAHAETQR